MQNNELYLGILIKSIDDFKNYLENQVLQSNEKFLNEGHVNFKLIELLIKNGINRDLLRQGYPNRIDISIKDSIFIELKYLREAESEKGKSFAETKKFGELWKDIAKLSSKESDYSSFVLLISDLRFYRYMIKNFPTMLKENGYILNNKELDEIKNRVFNTSTMKKQLKELDLNNINSLSIKYNFNINENKLNFILYKVN